jgi:hypothetical protein
MSTGRKRPLPVLIFEASMRTPGSPLLAALFLSALFASILPASPLSDPPLAPPKPPSELQPPPVPRPSSDTTYPQIVRIRYMEGDVRIARGAAQKAQVEKATGDQWEQAVANLPLETGFSLVTGAGRAELEFEDASTLYLARNSALAFDDLHTTRGIPHTELTLLAGTATIHFYPSISGDSYLLRTPTDAIITSYPDKSYVRVDSYLDAVAVTPQIAADPLQHVTYHLSGSPAQAASKGLTAYYDNGAPVAMPPTADPDNSAAWDKWVAARVNERNAALNALRKQSGLPTSIPGLADMNAQGTFFPCAPYGTCWMPTAADDQQQVDAQPNSAPDFALILSRTEASVNPGGRVKLSLTVAPIAAFSGDVILSTTLPAGFSCVISCAGSVHVGVATPLELLAAPSVPPGDYSVVFTGHAGSLEHQATLIVHVLAEPVADFEPPITGAYFPYFPCAPAGVHTLLFHDRFARPHIVSLGIGAGVPAYSWAVCHAGTWLYREHGYVWVAGTKRHHHPPICWVKDGRKYGYVPRHPRDVAGQPPHNRLHEVYLAGEKKNDAFEAGEFKPGSKLETLASPPREFRAPDRPLLARADEPTIAAHPLKDGLAHAGVPLRFDHKSQSFLLVSEHTEGGHAKTIATPFAPRPSSTLHTHAGNIEPHPTAFHPTTPHPTATHPTATHIGASHPTPAAHNSTPHVSAPHPAAASHPPAASHSAVPSPSHTGTHH